MSHKRKAYVLIGFFCILVMSVSGQDQKIADSLKKLYQQKNLVDTNRFELLRNIAFNEVKDNKLAIRYAEQLINLSIQKGNQLYLHRGYFLKGNHEKLLGNLEVALSDYFKSGAAAQRANYGKGEANTDGAIANIYAVSGNHANARIYFKKAIAILRKSTDSIALGSVILNAGDEFLTNKFYDSALLHFKESQIIFEKANYPMGKAYALGNIGMVYAYTGQSNLAEKNINEAITILETSQDYYPICIYLLSMSDIYQKKGDNATAMNYAMRSLHLAMQFSLKEQISSANLKISELYEKNGKSGEALAYYRNYIAYRDSLNNVTSVQKLADLRTDYEVAQKQTEVDLLNQQKKNQRSVLISLIIILALVMLLSGTLFWYFRAISKEKKVSENLLLNILPFETARELKLKGRVDAVKFDQVTILFTDFVAFSRLAEKVMPEQLVKSIDYYFKSFDEITTRHGLEKIKTIGDSYMCACGLPTGNPSHATNVILAAKEMIELVNNEWHANDGLCHFEIRIGIHTGPVVAGIVGIKKWQYDIWGDTVNIASRMESKSEPGRINLSETTYEEIKDDFPCEFRGAFEVKNRGTLNMYFLS